MPFVTLGNGQLYVVPTGAKILGGVVTGDNVNAFPVQTESLRLGILGMGFITIGTETVVSPQSLVTLTDMI